MNTHTNTISPYVFTGLSYLPKVTATPEQVLNFICQKFDVDIEIMRSRTRLRRYTDLRHAFFYICRDMEKYSYNKLGKLLNRNHSTVTHAVKQVNDVKEKYQIALMIIGSMKNNGIQI